MSAEDPGFEPMSAIEVRFYCRLYPCAPQTAWGPNEPRPDAAGGVPFASHAAYDRHLRFAHFLEPGAPGVPEPYTSTRMRVL